MRTCRPRHTTFPGSWVALVTCLVAGMLSAQIHAAAPPANRAISGSVFEDVNYGGGSGRDRTTATSNAGSNRPNARVELFDSNGNFVSSTLTDINGDYTFGSLNPGDYTVRVVNGSVSSGRPGYQVGVHRAVQTFRTDAATGSVLAVTDRVGGESPQKVDAGNGSTNISALTTSTTTPQSITEVHVTSSDITGVDFGFSFAVIVNANNAGQGSLEQFIINATGLGSHTMLVQAGTRRSITGTDEPLPAGVETSIFMIADGLAHPGLRAGLVNQLTGGVAIIAPSTLSPITGERTNLDATTQTVNVGNTNAVMLGTGGTVGTEAIALAQVPGPEVQLTMASSGNTAFRVQAGNTAVRGFAVVGSTSGSAIEVASGSSSSTLELNVLGSSATSFTDPGGALRNQQNIGSTGGTNTLVRNDLIGFSASVAMSMPSGSSGWQIIGNELVNNGLSTTNGDGIIITSSTGGTIQGNRIAGTSTQGIILNMVSGLSVTNNTVSGNGVGNTSGMDQSAGITVRGGCNAITFDRNVVAANYGAGAQVNDGSTGICFTRNDFHDNGTISARNGAAPTGQIGIDLNGPSDNTDLGTSPFYTLNDGGDGDAGGNGLQNFPALVSCVTTGGNTTIQGTINGTPNATFRIEFFSNASGDPSGYGEGQLYLGWVNATTNGAGNSTINTTLSGVSVPSGYKVSATATNTATSNSSEFSATITATGPPPGIGVLPLSLNTQEAGATSANFTVVLNALPAANVTISLSSDDPTEGSLNASSLTFTPADWNVPQTVVVTGVDELVDDGDISYTIVTGSASSADPLYNGMAVDDVTVTNIDDDASPLAICQDLVLALAANGAVALTGPMVDGGSSDDLGISSMSVVPNNFSCADIGANSVTLTVMDAGGNGTACTATVTIIDAIAPQISCPADLTVNTDPGTCGALVNYAVPIGTDNCTGATTLLSAGLGSGSFFPTGTTTETYTVTDGIGTQTSCSFTIQVIDATDPVILCPPDITVTNDPGACGTVVDYAAPVGIDDCAPSMTTLIAGLATGSLFPTGVTSTSYLVTDPSGNTASCAFSVEVIDATPPLISCPSDILVSNDPGICGALVSYAAPIASDDCDGSIMTVLTAGLASGGSFPIGTTIVVHDAMNAAGLTSSCSFSVTVADDELPVVLCQPLSVTLDGSGPATITAAQANLGSTDNCGIASMSVSPDTFSAPGSYTAHLVVVDLAGNMDSCSMIVTVMDDQAPVASCQGLVIHLDLSGNASITAAQVDGGSTDNGVIVSSVVFPSSFDCAQLGNNNVTLTVTDAGGNSDACVAMVTVLDTIAPLAICQGINLEMDPSGSVTVAASQLDGGSTDNCGGLTFSCTPNTFSAPGDHPVTLTLTDLSGNSSQCFSTVTVLPTIPPTAVCQSVTVHLDAGGLATITANDIDGGSTDNGTIVSRTVSPTEFDCSHLGVNTVTLTVTDDQGNSDACSAVVTVLDTTAPQAVCQSIAVALDAHNVAIITAVQVDNGSHDNCGIATMTVTPSEFHSVGIHIVTLTVADASGNSSACQTEVNVGSGMLFEIPSGFSPNGDGIADTWEIHGLDPGSIANVQVLNRWGDVVYASADYHNDWDGTGRPQVGPAGALPDGTYFYIVLIKDDRERTMNGYLQIAR